MEKKKPSLFLTSYCVIFGLISLGGVFLPELGHETIFSIFLSLFFASMLIAAIIAVSKISNSASAKKNSLGLMLLAALTYAALVVPFYYSIGALSDPEFKSMALPAFAFFSVYMLVGSYLDTRREGQMVVGLGAWKSTLIGRAMDFFLLIFMGLAMFAGIILKLAKIKVDDALGILLVGFTILGLLAIYSLESQPQLFLQLIMFFLGMGYLMEAYATWKNPDVELSLIPKKG